MGFGSSGRQHGKLMFLDLDILLFLTFKVDNFHTNSFEEDIWNFIFRFYQKLEISYSSFLPDDKPILIEDELYKVSIVLTG